MIKRISVLALLIGMATVFSAAFAQSSVPTLGPAIKTVPPPDYGVKWRIAEVKPEDAQGFVTVTVLRQRAGGFAVIRLDKEEIKRVMKTFDVTDAQQLVSSKFVAPSIRGPEHALTDKDYFKQRPGFVIPSEARFHQMALESLAKGKCPDFRADQQNDVNDAFEDAYRQILDPHIPWLTNFNRQLRRQGNQVKVMREANRGPYFSNGEPVRVMVIRHGKAVIFRIKPVFGEPTFTCRE